ncbi:PREDICTED: uncharacterized protein LOC109244892 [Nicotiana attenuata]|uniref:uncharacterized protein LOC109244892 n=1 Tax=Nicotiana attenuata TaxID=49451 RepID=UPI000905507D|nr:PREDICTED: uncharacterized protein LOC109244892 [Nicotiana attenuata]
MTNGSSSTTADSEFIPRVSSPLFLHSSDIPGMSLVVVPFSGCGFGGWRRSIIVSLSARNKIAFIDSSFPKPTAGSPESKQWDRCNNMVISWLTSSLTPEIAESVQYSDTAESIWKQLNNRYGTINETKKFEIKKELASTCQGPLDIASYFNKLKKLWNELGAMGSNHANTCTCAAKESLLREDEENKVHQFLMGLNETYITVRSNILMMNPLPSLDNVYNILLQDEKQRQMTPNTHFTPDLASFNANATTPTRFPPHFQPQRQYTQKINFDSPNQRLVSNQNKDLFCKYCKKSGHTIGKCYKLIGFPQGFKFTKGRRFGTAANVESSKNSNAANVGSNGPVSGIPGLTMDPPPNFEGSANFAGSNLSLLELNGVAAYSACMLTSVARSVWIVDSGATDHMTSAKELLFNITPLPVPYLVSLPNGYKVKVTCTGSLTLNSSFVLHKDLSRKKLLVLGRLHQGLYKLHHLSNSPPSDSVLNNDGQNVSSSSLSDSVLNINIVQNVSSSSLNTSVCSLNESVVPSVAYVHSVQHVNNLDMIWHNRMGHLPFAKLKCIPSVSSDLSTKQPFICSICPLAKQARLPFPDSTSNSTSLFQLIHIDTGGLIIPKLILVLNIF